MAMGGSAGTSIFRVLPRDSIPLLREVPASEVAGILGLPAQAELDSNIVFLVYVAQNLCFLRKGKETMEAGTICNEKLSRNHR